MPDGRPLGTRPRGSVVEILMGSLPDVLYGPTVAPRVNVKSGVSTGTWPPSESINEATKRGTAANVSVTWSLAWANPRESSEETKAVSVSAPSGYPLVMAAGTVTVGRLVPVGIAEDGV
jgi:hypothetical protein